MEGGHRGMVEAVDDVRTDLFVGRSRLVQPEIIIVSGSTQKMRCWAARYYR